MLNNNKKYYLFMVHKSVYLISVFSFKIIILSFLSILWFLLFCPWFLLVLGYLSTLSVRFGPENNIFYTLTVFCKICWLELHSVTFRWCQLQFSPVSVTSRAGNYHAPYNFIFNANTNNVWKYWNDTFSLINNC